MVTPALATLETGPWLVGMLIMVCGVVLPLVWVMLRGQRNLGFRQE